MFLFKTNLCYDFIDSMVTGQVLMLTTPDDPQQMVGRLRYRSANMEGIMHGYYRLVADTVSIL